MRGLFGKYLDNTNIYLSKQWVLMTIVMNIEEIEPKI